MSFFLGQLFIAIVLAALYLPFAISVTFMYDITDVVPMAQGSVMVVGGYAAYIVMERVANLALGAVVAVVVTGLAGAIVYDVIFRHLLGKGHAPLVAGISLGILIQELVRINYNEGNPIVYPSSVLGGLSVSGTGLKLILIGIGTALSLLFELGLRFTSAGRELRAVATNREMAALLGIRIHQMFRLSFIIGSAMAGISGVLIAVYSEYFTPFIGSTVMFAAVAAVLLGGLGSIPGAVIGAVVVTIAETLTASYLSSGYSDAVAFALILLLLLWRPLGLFGEATEVRA